MLIVIIFHINFHVLAVLAIEEPKIIDDDPPSLSPAMSEHAVQPTKVVHYNMY